MLACAGVNVRGCSCVHRWGTELLRAEGLERSMGLLGAGTQCGGRRDKSIHVVQAVPAHSGQGRGGPRQEHHAGHHNGEGRDWAA